MMRNIPIWLGLLFLGCFLAPPAIELRAQEVAEGTFLGEPLAGITPLEFELFRLGLEDFLEVEDAAEGLGPVFNGRSCAECHSIPRIGGSGTVLEIRAGILGEDGIFQELPGGSLIQMFSIPPHQVQPMVPLEANVVAHRKPIPLFGNGLVEAVPDQVLAALEDPDDLDGDGISGRAHWVVDKASGELRVGRFGWKAQIATLLVFGADAYLNEMGITNDLFPNEFCPSGTDCEMVELVDSVPDPEDGPEPATGLRGIDNFESFMLLLGPPPRGVVTEQERRGEEVFSAVRCSACHVPSLQTGESSVGALRMKRFFPYGDFLLHDIGTGDGIRQDDAAPTEIRTPPLWGVRFRAPFMHDGRASTLREAIEMHAAEAENSRRLYEELSGEDKAALRSFLDSL